MKADTLITETTHRIFSDLADPQTVNQTSNGWQSTLWQVLEDAGLTLAWCSEEVGGAGASLLDGFAIQEITGQFCTPIPLSETLLAGWLLERSEITPEPGMMTIVPIEETHNLSLNDKCVLNGIVNQVPFAGEVDKIVALVSSGDGFKVVVIPCDACNIVRVDGITSPAKGRVSCSSVQPLQISNELSKKITPKNMRMMGALMRVSQMTGAMQTLLEMCVSYAQERKAFGRPIGKFQVIQHNLAILAGELAAALAATGAATNSVARDPSFGADVFFNVASAKIRVGEAANQVAAIAHQLHGAMGFTKEHILHQFTHSLWTWRDEFGSEATWAVELGENVLTAGPDGLWPMLTAS